MGLAQELVYHLCLMIVSESHLGLGYCTPYGASHSQDHMLDPIGSASPAECVSARRWDFRPDK